MAEKSTNPQDRLPDDSGWVLVEDDRDPENPHQKLGDYLLHLIPDIQKQLDYICQRTDSELSGELQSPTPQSGRLADIGDSAGRARGDLDIVRTLANNEGVHGRKDFFLSHTTADILASRKTAAEMHGLDITYNVGHWVNRRILQGEGQYRYILTFILDTVMAHVRAIPGRITLFLEAPDGDGIPPDSCVAKLKISYTANGKAPSNGKQGDPIMDLYRILRPLPGERRDEKPISLSLTQHLIQRFNGKVWAEGGLDMTTFHLDLPFRSYCWPGYLRLSGRTLDGYEFHRILIIHGGHEGYGRAIARDLKLAGIRHRIFEAATDDSVALALQEAYSEDVDCAIVDSLQLATKFKQLQTSRRIPIVVAAPDISVGVSLLAAGNNFTYLKTPCSTDEFGLALHHAIRTAPPALLSKVSRFSILAAEDNAVNRKVLTKLLEKADIAVQLANDGLEAVELAKKNKYAAILMDIQMPNMSGLEAAARIREWESANNLPRVPIVAVDVPSVKKKWQAPENFDAFILKPYKQNQLTRTLRFFATDGSTSWGDL